MGMYSKLLVITAHKLALVTVNIINEWTNKEETKDEEKKEVPEQAEPSNSTVVPGRKVKESAVKKTKDSLEQKRMGTCGK